jgi:hypothetical protein
MVGQHVNTDRLIEILEKRCKIDFGGIKRKRSVPLSELKDSAPKKRSPKSTSKREHYMVSNEELKQAHAAQKYSQYDEKKHHHAATRIQKNIRRKLTELKQKDGKLHPHKVAIGNNWYERIDEKTHKVYYFNSKTRQTQWDVPKDRIHRIHEEKHWREIVDKKSGKTY